MLLGRGGAFVDHGRHIFYRGISGGDANFTGNLRRPDNKTASQSHHGSGRRARRQPRFFLCLARGPFRASSSSCHRFRGDVCGGRVAHLHRIRRCDARHDHSCHRGECISGRFSISSSFIFSCHHRDRADGSILPGHQPSIRGRIEPRDVVSVNSGEASFVSEPIHHAARARRVRPTRHEAISKTSRRP